MALVLKKRAPSLWASIWLEAQCFTNTISSLLVACVCLMDEHGEKTVWIQVSWLHQKPADLELHCFQKRAKNLKKVSYGLIWSNTVIIGSKLTFNFVL